ncbi:MAG: phosphotransferase family protein [Myxococcota bacterium]
MSGIPGPDEVTPEFVTRCLQAAGHPGVEVRGLRGTRIGTGQIGQCIRYELDYAAGAERAGAAPRTLVGKFPSDDPTSRQTGVALRNYLKEVSFYTRLQPRLGIRTPRCYYAAIEGSGPEHVLLLEDLAPATQGNQLEGCTREVARAAVLELVGLHAPTWCDETLLGLEWLGAPDEQMVQIGRMLYRSQLPAFLERFRSGLLPDEVDIIERVAESQGPPFEALGEPFSVIHVDYRLDNLLIDASQSPPAIAAVDWQSLTLGSPLSDVAYFIGAGLLREERREVERDLVAAYHRALEEKGIEDYDAARCWNDYRRSVFAGLAVTVVAAPLVVQTERGDEMFAAMARRHARHALDLGSEEFLR